ncbi:hypothetical protein Landi51_13446 [Colletotrichum acutatum]
MTPTQQQWEAALLPYNKFYLENIERRAKEEGIEFRKQYEWSKDYLRPTEELYRGFTRLPMINDLFNEPDGHGEDWNDWDAPSDNLLIFHMHLQMVKWQRLISSSDRARQEKQPNGYCGQLYSTPEDRERRSGPSLQPKFPKSLALSPEVDE